MAQVAVPVHDEHLDGKIPQHLIRIDRRLQVLPGGQHPQGLDQPLPVRHVRVKLGVVKDVWVGGGVIAEMCIRDSASAAQSILSTQLGRDDLQFVEKEYDLDDGEYEVEFVLDGVEYEYEVNAYTGKVTEMDAEFQDYDDTDYCLLYTFPRPGASAGHCGASGGSGHQLDRWV